MVACQELVAIVTGQQIKDDEAGDEEERSARSRESRILIGGD